jgi:hypothetical protein
MSTPRPALVLAGVGLAALCAALVNLGVATLATALVPVPNFTPLQPIAYVPYSVFGVVVGAIGWTVIRRAARRPAPLLRRLVPIVVVLSFIPDLVLYGLGSVGVVPIVALMLMHIVVAAVGVTAYARVLPVTDEVSAD